MTDTSALPPFPFATPASLNTDPDGLRLRAEGPVARARMVNDGQEVWLALGYHANRFVMSDPRFSREEAMKPGGVATLPAAVGVMDVLTSMDPPRHTRVRRLLAGAFTARMIDRLKPQVQSIVDELLDDVAAQDKPVDLLDRYISQLPIMVICDLLGVPRQDRSILRGWAERFAATDSTPEEFAAAHRDAGAYLQELIAAKRAEPGDDLTTALTQVHDEDGDRLTEPELVINIQTLLIAGFETTVNQLANGIVALSRNPDQFDLLRANPALAPQAMEELFRWDKLFNANMPKIAMEDVAVDGQLIPAGDVVVTVPNIANRDPAVFDDPDRFDIMRPNANQHLTFIYGPHFCLGAHLARTEMRIALESLMRRFPKVELAVDDTELRWKTARINRSLVALPVTW